MIVVLSLAAAGCRERRVMLWEPGTDGFEHSYFYEPDAPVVYVKRKLLPDACIFGDFPEEGDVETRVACGATWKTADGRYQLRCACLPAVDAGKRPTAGPRLPRALDSAPGK